MEVTSSLRDFEEIIYEYKPSIVDINMIIAIKKIKILFFILKFIYFTLSLWYKGE
ncbi:hypothetical protein D3C81_1294600 [compost metagenome]